jgi:hypothetical protein
MRTDKEVQQMIDKINLERIREHGNLKTSIESTNDSLSSVEISCNSKGIITWKIKVYDSSAISATNKAVQINEKLRVKYSVEEPVESPNFVDVLTDYLF